MTVCIRCNGQGQYMGIGFMMTECTHCKYEYEEEDHKPSLDKINRNSKSYQKAIKELMTNLDIPRKEAINLFEQEYLKC